MDDVVYLFYRIGTYNLLAILSILLIIMSSHQKNSLDIKIPMRNP